MTLVFPMDSPTGLVIAPLTMQDMIDRNYQYFFVEGHPPSYDAKLGLCRYNIEDKTHCSIGCVIPYVLYHADIEKNNIAEILSTEGKISQLFSQETKGRSGAFLKRLQDAHDDNPESEMFIKDFEVRLKQLCKDYGLEFNKSDKGEGETDWQKII
jgi:hypothetical protein